MLKIGLVGCGTMSESHLMQIEKIPYAKLVGVCDAELLMAKQVTLRYDVKDYFDDLDLMIQTVSPDIVHITTPPNSHYLLAKKCLDSGIHVYVEKPFTLYYREAVDLIETAEKKGLKITVGHNAQFSKAAEKLRNLVKGGFLGGNPVHMESLYCYNWGNENYAKAIIGDSKHWVNSLPGKLLQNIISHGISKIAEYFDSDDYEMRVLAFQSPFLKGLGSSEIIDELRLTIGNGNTTAYFTFSSMLKPSSHAFKIYGPKRGLELDHNRQTVSKIQDWGYKSYLKYVFEPIKIGKQYRKEGWDNLKGLYRQNVRGDYGIHKLTSDFYKAVLGEGPLPISYREILLTSKIMESVFENIHPNLHNKKL